MQPQFHPALAGLSLLAYLAVGLALPVFNTRLGKSSGQHYREGFGRMSSHMLDNLQGLKEVVQFGAGQLRLQEMTEKIQELGKLQKDLKRCEGVNKASTDCTILLFTAFQILLAAYLAKGQFISNEQAILAAVLQMSSFGPVTALSSLSNNLLQTLASGQRVLGLLAEEPETEENTDGIRLQFTGAQLQHVDFA